MGCRPGWRNGSRDGLKIRCPRGRVGSTPTPGTTVTSPHETSGPENLQVKRRCWRRSDLSFCHQDSVGWRGRARPVGRTECLDELGGDGQPAGKRPWQVSGRLTDEADVGQQAAQFEDGTRASGRWRDRGRGRRRGSTAPDCGRLDRRWSAEGLGEDRWGRWSARRGLDRARAFPQ